MDVILPSSFKPKFWHKYTVFEQNKLLDRPNITNRKNISNMVNKILQAVKKTGDEALYKFNYYFNKISIKKLQVSPDAFLTATNNLSAEFKQAIKIAKKNIECFHKEQVIPNINVEIHNGIVCSQVTKPIFSVGLYIPGGSAPLFSTVLMLAIPACIAGCSQIILCSPPPIANEILYTAMLCGVRNIYQVGGAQAIASMAFGTQTIPKVNKIFGPGNNWVTEAKRQVSFYANKVAIDMLAGPSEVLIIADKNANPRFIAADLLSQAEHGPDSQVILLTTVAKLAEEVLHEITIQLRSLPRAEIIKESLLHSHLIIVQTISECISITNRYGPEHLLIQTNDAESIVNYITNAGSIFLGMYSPESAGDYASGTNHVLPTGGLSCSHSALSVTDFQKRITIQKVNYVGLLTLAPTVEILAQAEKLIAHKNSISFRVTNIDGFNNEY